MGIEEVKMTKFKIVISLGIHTTVVEAKDEDEAIEKAGDEWVALLEGINMKDFVEVYPADAEDIAEFEKERGGEINESQRVNSGVE